MNDDDDDDDDIVVYLYTGVFIEFGHTGPAVETRPGENVCRTAHQNDQKRRHAGNSDVRYNGQSSATTQAYVRRRQGICLQCGIKYILIYLYINTKYLLNTFEYYLRYISATQDTKCRKCLYF